LREAAGDPLFVRAGHGLVPTPRALELRDRVGQLVQDGEAVLRPAQNLNLRHLVRTFTLRTSEGFVENFGPDLLARIGEQAPGVRLRFMQKPDKDSAPLRDGTVDLETGVVVKTTAPEVRAQALFRDRFVGVVRMGHSLSKGKITSSRYAAGRHICVSRRGFDEGPIDEEGPIREALKRVGLVSQSSVAFRLHWLSLGPPTWSLAFPNDTPENCEPACTVFPCWSPRRSSRCPCSGTLGWMPIPRIAGCGGVSRTLARSH
jgi:DNA-binding transcriptional LysR family regulator